ncbi:MAG TPA: TIM44-like domain-containing protein [Rhodocyclaceae bacterium]|nr:TIM44-like domain-containing protein [Rhodocyclaceae bacterium]
MKRVALTVFSLTLALGLGFSANDAEAKRLGGGGSFGMSRNSAPMQRQYTAPPKQANPAPQQAAPTAAPAPQPAAQPSGMSRWLGPIAGIAAGVGLAALLSHFGMGEGMANVLMIAALVMLAIFVIRLLFGRREPAPAYAGNVGNSGSPARFEPLQPAAGSSSAVAAADEPVAVPADFDTAGFLRQAKINFTRLQAANDAGNMDDIKAFTAPEVFAEVQMQYEERGKTKQQTDVMQLDAELVEVVSDGNRHIASVRFHGLLREDAHSAPASFDEVWHLVKPLDGSDGWRVAGIQQIQ